MAINEDLSGLITEDDYCASCEIHYSDEETEGEDGAGDEADTEEADEETAVDDVPIYSTKTGKWALKGRFKSWALWLSILGALGVILEATGVFDKIGIDSTGFDVFVNAIGSVLVTFGILNNPTDTEAF